MPRQLPATLLVALGLGGSAAAQEGMRVQPPAPERVRDVASLAVEPTPKPGTVLFSDHREKG